jgi:peptidoglycan/xylan/chitin deacetylase (PgdA/CDA1 family)
MRGGRLGVASAALLSVALASCGGAHHARFLAASHASLHVRRVPSPPSPAAIQQAALERLIRLGYPIFCGGHRGNEVAFTFDDGPGVYTHYAIRKLSQAREGATFFVVGKSMNAWPGWVAREAMIGAAIGDHTYTHPFLPALSPAEIRSQIDRTKLEAERESGRPVYLFRPPYGAVDPTVDRIVSSLGLLRIMWTVDSRDSLGANWLGIIRNVEAGLHPGSIILMHENRGQTIRALTTLLPYLQRHHIRSVSIPQLLASDPPSLAQLRGGASGCGAGRVSLRGA